ncbi:hypothetical protein [Gluconobacter oxydans]|uniref:hypothetical protein n=1 Tax=Gluconobacter oxydans TaxID=442 RepID=UPI000A81F4E8|nr:hypothetical protein [Gluconobacter oxydans]
MSEQELRRWAIELTISKLARNWFSMFVLSEILIQYIRDGKIPPFDDDGNLDLNKWLENHQGARDSSDGEPA